MRAIERLAASVLCVGFEGTSPQTIPERELHELAPGGLILFSRNVTDAEGTREMADAAVRAAGGDVPAFVGADQEGGRVARFVDGAARLPSMLTLGATGDEDLARRTGRALAYDLRRFGATVNFAPTLDLALEPANTNIGTRSFGADPAAVGRMGAALIEAMQGAGVAAAAKHFPGHGATAVDSHLDLPAIAADEATLRHRELVPFRAAIAAGVKLIMTAHIVVDAIDPGVPATLSKALLTEMLRDELGFGGVCVTDSMEMGAIAKHFGTVPAVVRAIAAGADCALVCHSLEVARAARDALVAAVEAGELPIERLEEAASRVHALRAWCAAAPAGGAGDPGLPEAIARGALRVVRGAPVVDPARPVTVISFEGSERAGVEDRSGDRPSLALALRERRIRAESMRVPLDPSTIEIDHLRDVLSLEGRPQLVVVMRRAHLHAGQRHAVEALLAIDPDAILISALEPFDAQLFPAAQHVVALYGDHGANVEAAAGALTGRA